MSNAFSSIDYRSIRANTPAETAVKRLNGIGEVLSDLDISAIHTQADMTRALLTLDTADKCIRMILTEFRTAPAREEIVRKAKSLVDLIELARDEISNNRDVGAVLT
ncbi:hypothetical protein [Bradyrhizobium sp. 141]|uniref:hypothetical protein n=1 Tax=Bradyrhizobium sp. 141 TaxID=2782617 RepID=UPI001FF8AA23|nr:hypothetical protein [Bradyrhizobium sp. 141]MCK1717042.1 hypothetical protein [Bradyrhizobium sp. 141]